MKWLGIIAVAACLAAAGTAQAQKKMYKCGSQFQDRPCDGGGTVGAAKAPEAPVVPQRTAAQEEAQRKIRCENWGRQVAVLREREQATQNDAVARGLVVQQRNVIEKRMQGDGCG
jgi:hypothetical protein